MDYIVRFKTRHVGGHGKGAGDVWTAKILPNRTVGQLQLAKMLAADGGMPAETVHYLLTRTWTTIMSLLRQGCNVNLEAVRFSLQATGTFPYENSPFDPDRNGIVVRATTTGVIRKAPRTKQTPQTKRDGLPVLKPVNVLEHTVSDRHMNVTDDKAFLVNVITAPSRILVAGVDMLISQDRPDEGVQFISRRDGTAYVPRITANTAGTIDLEFDELPPAGEYSMVVRSRSFSMSPSVAPIEHHLAVVIDPAAAARKPPR